MHRIVIAALIAVVALTVCISTTAFAKQVRPGAFLADKADSVEALARQVSSNPSVAARFSKHFHMTGEALSIYFKNNLRLTTLKSPLKISNYYISKNDRIVRKERTLPAGSRVFTTLDGKPVLDASCGNPLVAILPTVKVMATPPNPMAAIETPVVQVAGIPMEVGQIPAVIPPAADALPIPIAAGPSPTIIPVTEAASAPSIMAMPGLPSIGWVVPALLGAVSVQSSSRSSAVPEPASLIVLASATSGLMLIRIKRRIRSRR